jgi:large subunit ribosomal protein L37Ae
MGRTKKIGLAGGLKSRYGTSVRKRFVEAATESRKKPRCPNCNRLSVRRHSIGIWNCRRCGATFTGGAYSPSTKLGLTAKRVAKKPSAE